MRDNQIFRSKSIVSCDLISRFNLIIYTIMFFSILLALSGCDSPCENEIISENVSPNSMLKAVVFQRDCGATTGFSTQVSILKLNQALDDSAGNIFITDENHGQAPAGPGSGSIVITLWVSEKNLEIAYNSRVRIFRQEKLYGPITINYVHIQ